MPWLKEIFSLVGYKTGSAFFDSLFQNQESASGVAVNDSTVIGMPAIYAAVRAISETLAQMPLVLMREDAEGGVVKALEHPAYNLLGSAPNNYQTASEFIALMQSRLCIRHNAYALIERQRGAVKSLKPIHPARVEIEADELKGITSYRILADNGVQMVVRPDKICLLYTSPSPRDRQKSRMPSSA